MKPDDPTVLRLRRHLASVKERYPQAWDQLASFRRQKAELGGWPSWCDVPLSGAFAIVTHGVPSEQAKEIATKVGRPDVAVVGGLGTWRMTQGIYRYDPELLEALWTTPVEKIPVELLYRLPEWCVYLETPGRGYEGLSMHGAFLWLEYDVPTGRSELRALLDVEDGQLIPGILHLDQPDLESSIEATLGESLKHMPLDQSLPAGAWQAIRESFRTLWPSLISLALYLCSEEPDVMTERGAAERPTRPRPGKRGDIIPASAPTGWVIGSRLGRALREARERDPQGGTHASPRGHVRRAHWATYWTGPKSTPQKPVLKWLPPIPVNLQTDDLPATIHPVE